MKLIRLILLGGLIGVGPLLPSMVAAQVVGNESQEIPRIVMFLNEIRDLPVKGFRNLVVTNTGIVDIENLPSEILRVRALGAGSTIVYVWDSTGRRTLQFDVNGTSPNQSPVLRPGYDPTGSEFIYHTTMNSQKAGDDWASPFWVHEFNSSIPFNNQSEWRTLLRTSTNAGRFDGDYEFAPFSGATRFDQILTYYQGPRYNAALGDVNYNPGELSIISFPLRGASFQLYGSGMRDQIQFFGGLSRPQIRTTQLFDGSENQLYGVAGTKELASDIYLKSSFVYLAQPQSLALFPGQTFQNEYVADLLLQARPFSDEFAFEGEYARSAEDNSFRALFEYSPFWGRTLVSFKQIGKNYVKPVRFSLIRNYREFNFINDVQTSKKMGLLFNYQWTNLGYDPIQQIQETTTHRFSVNSLYQKSEETSYLTGVEVGRTQSTVTPQNHEQLNLTYQYTNKQTRDQWFLLSFLRHSKNFFLTDYSERHGVGFDMRYTKNYSRIFQLYLQNLLQFNRVKNTGWADPSNAEYIETILNLGPTLNYTPGNKAFNVGIFNNLNFRSAFERTTNLLQPFASAYYNPSQALSLGLRINYSIDPGKSYNFLSILAELVYRFGSRVPDTLLTTFSSTTKIKGFVFVDGNDDGVYQEGEKLVPDVMVSLNGSSKKIPDGSFEYKANSGANSVFVELPNDYKNYQFSTSNPVDMNLVSSEIKTLHFGISQRIPVQGKVVMSGKGSEGRGFEGAKIEITGANYRVITSTSISGGFNVFVPEPGAYSFKLHEMDLPVGYKTIGTSKIDMDVQGGQVNKIKSFILDGKRLVVGQVFMDLNHNDVFDDGDRPIAGLKITLGKTTVVTEDDGSFSVPNMAAGSYLVRVQSKTFQGYKIRPFNDRLVVPDVGTAEMNIPYAK